MADMRKDRRAPASLKVKYKSATVDQFIEQFGTDVSNSGMFIKTKTPLDIGALLKLELQLSDASPVIQGVGRVCWRRVPSEGTQLPPGMGIKFVKLEDASRATVERIVNGRGGSPSRFDQTEGAEVADISEPIARVDAGVPPASPPAAAAVTSLKPAAAAAFKPATANRPGAIPPPSPSLPAAGAKPPTAPRPAAPSPFKAAPLSSTAPTHSAAPKAIPSVRSTLTGATAGIGPNAPAGASAATGASAGTGANAGTGTRAPVAGLFTDSPMSRVTPEPAAPRQRSSFFPPAPNVNGNAPPPAPAGISSRPPPAPVARAGGGSAPHSAGAFGAAPRVEQPVGLPPSRAEEEDAIDRLFDDVVQPRSTLPPSADQHAHAGAAHAGVSQPSAAATAHARGASIDHDEGLFADDAPLPPRGSFANDWSASSSATTSLHSSAVTQLEAGVPPDFGDDQFGEAEIGSSGPPLPDERGSHSLPIPRLAQSTAAPAPPRKSPWPVIAGAVAVLAVGGFIAMQGMGPDPAPAPDAPAAVSPTSAAGAAAPVAAAGSAAESATAVPAAGAAAPAAAEPAAPAAAEPGAAGVTVPVEVTSTPRGAEVLVAGKLVGTAPMRVQLPVGVAVELSVRSTGYVALNRTVTASATPEPLQFKLEPLPYSVTVRTDPAGAEVSAEGHSTTAPGPLELGHLDGTIMMSVAKSGYQRVTRPLRLEEFIEQNGQMRAEVEVRLSPLPSERSRRRDREAPPAPAAPSEAPAGAAPPAQGSTGTVTPAPEPEAAPPTGAPEAPAAPAPPTPPELPAQP